MGERKGSEVYRYPQKRDCELLEALIGLAWLFPRMSFSFLIIRGGMLVCLTAETNRYQYVQTSPSNVSVWCTYRLLQICRNGGWCQYPAMAWHRQRATSLKRHINPIERDKKQQKKRHRTSVGEVTEIGNEQEFDRNTYYLAEVTRLWAWEYFIDRRCAFAS